ncbi:unnamed protein product [Arctogadus glacialis]
MDRPGCVSTARSLLLYLSAAWLLAATRAQESNFTRPVFQCGGDLVSDSGFVGSEDFPSYYKPNSKCTWRITGPPLVVRPPGSAPWGQPPVGSAPWGPPPGVRPLGSAPWGSAP